MDVMVWLWLLTCWRQMLVAHACQAHFKLLQRRTLLCATAPPEVCRGA